MTSVWQGNKIFKLCLICILILSIVLYVNRPVTAQSISSLNADINNLRSRINRLEAEIRRFQSNTDNKIPLSPKNEASPILGNPPVVNGRAIGPSDPFYERLATLLIELKEDVGGIDKRLKVIESKVN